MAITKTKNGTYRLRLYIPEDARAPLGIQSKTIEKRFKSKKEAQKHEVSILIDIQEALNGNFNESSKNKEQTLFSDFYNDVWWKNYKLGLTTSTNTPPTQPTIDNAELVFRLHILPLFGNYTLKFLNENKEVVINLLTQKASEYANFKTIRSYVNSVFNFAEELDYLEYNRLSKIIKRIKPTKKLEIESTKRDEDLFLTQSELKDWLNAIDTDLEAGNISLKDYVLFYTTFFLSDRKSETYALQWKHIDLINNKIQLIQTLDKYGKIKITKGKKKTIFSIPEELSKLLLAWKKQQALELGKFSILQTPEQLVFTYVDTKGNVNKPLHPDYLNYRMKGIMKRHLNLKYATPHKLRHTGATLAKELGMSLQEVSEALTHSDTTITQTYLNSANVIPMTAGEFTYRAIQN
ncbi:tyrosine-type recombinase/integrase [Vagococcus lutrae]|uniref:tyrosine-type recombinase/integrase n=1 Tax=Vagococcus lutrae TaxID=81947 RepID=UPI00200D6BE7|nr:tyrosine-type recombinase/integrase [Vagococcus lutrae]MDT2824178.1 tyrosine-type recombinase/integrase [Vagococcus lutrae]UQF18321.1 tyrosine-type recombinase/integrase [Vagococcus lutrae]